MKLKRPLRGSEIGADVRMVQRALNKAPSSTTIKVDGVYGETTKRRMRAFRRANSLSDHSTFDQLALDHLWPYFDAYGKMRYRAFRPRTKADVQFERLLTVMKAMSDETPGYLLGGGHGVPLDEVRYNQKLDCSSSTSLALQRAGMFPFEHALVSGEFYRWGVSGPGKYLTVYYNGTHVWVRLHRSRWWRFDTSPHGDGGRGPRLRYLPRFTSTFNTRHWEGM